MVPDKHGQDATDGRAEAAIRENFLGQADACDRLGSPFTAHLCRALAKILDRTTQTGRLVLDWPGSAREDALSLRLCGGLNQVVLRGADAELARHYPPAATDAAALTSALPGAIARNDAWLAASLRSPPQTNEIARSAVLYPGLMAIARKTGLPLHLNEIGSSAGLNLLLDRFAYDYGGETAGAAGAPVRLAPELRGGRIPLSGRLEIVSRTGSDIAPVDFSQPAERLRLRSYVWPDQAARLARLDAAIALAEAEPYVLARSDAADFVERRLESRPLDGAFVLMHSIMWQYLPEATRERVETAMERAGRDAARSAPVAWLRMEPLDIRDPHATLSLTVWPDGVTRHLARCDFHGRWLDWTA